MKNSIRLLLATAGLIALLVSPGPAAAHTGGSVAGGFLDGLLHPLSGLDHVLAMVAVGLWGVQLRRPAIWVLPVAFPLVMAVGAAVGVRGLPLPGVEIGVAGSALALGAAVAAESRPPQWVAAVVVSIFAIFHGYAHGVELPGSVNPVAYGVGFVLCTGLLHLGGIAVGVLHRWQWGAWAVRAGGGGIALTGTYLLAKVVAG